MSDFLAMFGASPAMRRRLPAGTPINAGGGAEANGGPGSA